MDTSALLVGVMIGIAIRDVWPHVRTRLLSSPSSRPVLPPVTPPQILVKTSPRRSRARR